MDRQSETETNVEDQTQTFQTAPSPHSRSSSLSSSSSLASRASGLGSTAALILEHSSSSDDEFYLSDDGTEDPRTPTTPGISQRLLSSSAPLPIYTTQLLLILPAFLLGSTMISSSTGSSGGGFSSTALGVVWFALFALLASFSNQIWIMLGRYVRKWSMEEVVAHAFVGGGGRRHGTREVWRNRIALVSRTGFTITPALLCAVYLREAVDLVFSQSPDPPQFLGRLVVAVVCAGLVTPFLLSPALASKRLLASALVALLSHILVVVFTFVYHFRETPDKRIASRAKVTLPTDSVNLGGFAILAFALASPLGTYPLYVSRLTPSRHIDSKRRRIPHPLHLLLTSVISCLALLPAYLVPAPPSQTGTPVFPIPTFQALALLSGIPATWTLAIVLRLPRNHQKRWRYGIWAGIALIAMLAPPIVHRVMKDLVIFCILFITYALPALLHIILHALRPPLSILVPEEEESEGGGSINRSETAATLLRRKERSLQRRRLWRRIVWDGGVWVVLAPVGVILCVWAAGRVVRAW